jgi:hypothetical protein
VNIEPNYRSKQIDLLTNCLSSNYLDQQSKRFIEYCISLLEDDHTIGLDRTTALFYAFLTSPVTAHLNKKLDISEDKRTKLLEICLAHAHSGFAKEYQLLERLLQFPLKEYFHGKIDLESLITSMVLYASNEPNWIYNESRLGSVKKALAIPEKIFLNSYDIYNVFQSLDLDILKLVCAISPICARSADVDLSVICEIIQNVDDNLLRKLSLNPLQIYQLDPATFEKLIARIYEKSGFKVSMVSGWNQPDGGVDILAVKHDELTGDLSVAIQCKKYSKTRKIQPSYIRELNGAIDRFKANKGVLVTTSSFSKKTIEDTQKYYWRIQLCDYLNLINALKRISAIKETDTT